MADRDEQRMTPEDQELARRLESALDLELSRQPVDVADLLRGTRRRTRRDRYRRSAVLAAAAVAVAAVPLGLAVAQQDGGGRPVPPAASGLPSDPPATASGTPEPSIAPSPELTEAPTPTRTEPVPNPVQANGVPGSVEPTPEEVGRGVTQIFEQDETNGPTLMGQGCGNLTESRRPAARQIWSFSDDDAGSFTVDVVVTGWQNSSVAFRSLTENTGTCSLPRDTRWEPRETGRADLWLAAGESGTGQQNGWAAQRLEGDVIITVSVASETQDVSATEASRILQVVVDRAVAAGIARVSG